MLKAWDKLPDQMKNDAVRPYYDILQRHQLSLLLKRMFDFIMAFLLLCILWPIMVIIGIAITLDSPGRALFFQERVTTYGKRFHIWKFRTMVENAERQGTAVTIKEDKRITKVGSFLRKTRLDELPQLVNILFGDMSFVGTRPEIVKYVEKYTPEMRATLLLPAGVTSEASIRYKDEYRLLSEAEDVDRVYIEKILPAKMKWNLNSIERFSFTREVLTMVRTILAVMGKEYK